MQKKKKGCKLFTQLFPEQNPSARSHKWETLAVPHVFKQNQSFDDDLGRKAWNPQWQTVLVEKSNFVHVILGSLKVIFHGCWTLGCKISFSGSPPKMFVSTVGTIIASNSSPNKQRFVHRVDTPKFQDLRGGNFLSVRKTSQAFPAVNEIVTPIPSNNLNKGAEQRAEYKGDCKSMEILGANGRELDILYIKWFSAQSCLSINCKCQWTSPVPFLLKSFCRNN